jgi:hypothetical protein
MNQEKADKWIEKNYPNHTDKAALLAAYMAGTTSMVDFLDSQNQKKEERIKAKKLEFAKKLEPLLPIHGRDFLNNFYGYWTEADLKSGKLRWEKEKTFEIERRITTFLNNNYSSKKPAQESTEKKYKSA